MTYIPSQDKNRMFLDKHLGEVADTYTLPLFTYDSLLRKARTVDVYGLMSVKCLLIFMK